MVDPAFIELILQKGRSANEKLRNEFANISFEELNWKASPQSWSIGQCFDHLIHSHNAYLPKLKTIVEGNFKMNFWERFSPFTKIGGRLLIEQLTEQPKRKFKAPKKIQPSSSQLEIRIIKEYQHSLDQFLHYISKCSKVDIDKTKILSPTISIVTYSLRDSFQFLLQHEHRHINQAIRVKKEYQQSLKTV